MTDERDMESIPRAIRALTEDADAEVELVVRRTRTPRVTDEVEDANMSDELKAALKRGTASRRIPTSFSLPRRAR